MNPVFWLECHRCRLLTPIFDGFFFASGATFGVALHTLVVWWREQLARETELARRIRSYVTQ